MGAFISIGLASSGQSCFSQNGAQRAAREGDLEVVASVAAGSGQNVGRDGVKRLLVRRRTDQAFLRRRDPPGLGRKAAKSETRRADFSARCVYDRGDGNQSEGVGSPVADFSIDLLACRRRAAE